MVSFWEALRVGLKLKLHAAEADGIAFTEGKLVSEPRAVATGSNRKLRNIGSG